MITKHQIYLAGASGLLAGEFLRLLGVHPGLELAGAYTRAGGQGLMELHPHLAFDSDTAKTLEFESLAADLVKVLKAHPADFPWKVVLLLGLPHGQSGPWWAAHRDRFEEYADVLVVVDMSADFRLESADAYKETYSLDHACPDELGHWACGLPELHTLPPGCKRIAVPGCFATAMQLAVLPAARAGLLKLDHSWILQGVTGSSGSGAHATQGTHHPHRNGNFKAYGLGGHRHEAELLTPRNFEKMPNVDFTPHSGSFSRGIFLHAILPLAAASDAAAIRKLYGEHYAGQSFVEVQASTPEVRQVAGSNRALIGITTRGTNLHAICAIDNTLKGGAGQAMQCLNLVLSFPQETALPISGLGY
ncbi:MAG: N-acetyl-gamma-glutamyl-phosphate reductase [bacterium]|nr:N-acetyl-gamma-glutamyl-phosphate reductase [bacterium]